MPEYVYQNDRGGERSIFARMSNPPPEQIVFNAKGHWAPAGNAPPGYSPEVYRRVYGLCQVNGDPVTKRYGFASNTLPRDLPDEVAEKDDKGRPIIRDAEHAKRVCEHTGFTTFE